VGNPRDRLSEDSLRLLRAIRFSVTKGFSINGDVNACLDQGYFIDKLTNVSVERVREELYKAFKHDTFKTILTLTCYGRLCNALFNRGHIRPLWLEPTLKSNRNAPEPCL
jgi:tRNA nucleotidyltransferase/poly(A) polymerase